MTRDAWILFAVFFAQAFASGGIFARIPDIQEQLALSDAALGLALTSGAVGALVSLFVSGPLVQRFGTKAVTLLSIPAMSLTHVAAALAPSQAVLIAALFIGGAAFSFSNVAINVEADRIEAATGTRVMNRCHGAWSLGMLLASLVGVGARALPVTPLAQFLAVLLLVALVAALLARAMAPAPPRGQGGRRRSFAAPDRVTLILVALGLSASIGQAGVQNWSVVFMRDSFQGPDWIDTLTLPAFLVTMALGRLFADQWIERFGPSTVARALASAGLLGTGLAVLSPGLWVALLGFALIGLGTAAIFPMVISAAARSPHRPAEDSVAAVIFLTSLAVLAVPALMGAVAEASNVRVAFAATLPFYVATLFLAGRLRGNS